MQKCFEKCHTLANINEEGKTSLKTTTKRPRFTNIPYNKTKWSISTPFFRPKCPKHNEIIWSHSYALSPYKGVPPSAPLGTQCSLHVLLMIYSLG